MSQYETRQSLILRLKNKQDEHSWQEFVVTYKGFISAVTRNLGINEGDIDDVTQKVILKAWEKLPEFNYDKNIGRFKNWLAQIIRNIALTFNRKQYRENNKIANFQESTIPQITDDSFNHMIEKQWKESITEMAWDNIKDKFSEDAQKCFSLLCKGFKNKDISLSLELKENTVAVYKKRIVAGLQKETLRLEAEIN